MDKRRKNKKDTRDLIMRMAKELFIKKGLLNLRTHEIAEHSGVAHGTIFSHFATKEILFDELFENEFRRIVIELFRFTNRQEDAIIILNEYLDFLEQEEDFFCMVMKEFPFYSASIKKKILETEKIIHEFLAASIEEGKLTGKYVVDDINAVLDMIFGLINYYLSRKEIMTNAGSVIELKRIRLIKLFYRLIYATYDEEE